MRRGNERQLIPISTFQESNCFLTKQGGKLDRRYRFEHALFEILQNSKRRRSIGTRANWPVHWTFTINISDSAIWKEAILGDQIHGRFIWDRIHSPFYLGQNSQLILSLKKWPWILYQENAPSFVPKKWAMNFIPMMWFDRFHAVLQIGHTAWTLIL